MTWFHMGLGFQKVGSRTQQPMLLHCHDMVPSLRRHWVFRAQGGGTLTQAWNDMDGGIEDLREELCSRDAPLQGRAVNGIKWFLLLDLRTKHPCRAQSLQLPSAR